MAHQPRVYYTTSRLDDTARDFDHRVVTMIQELGYATWFPREDAESPTELAEGEGLSLEEARSHIFNLNVQKIRDCDLVVLCLDGQDRDGDSSIAAGIAWGLGKRLIGLHTDSHDSSTMINGIIAEHVASIDELRNLLGGPNILIDLTGAEPVVVMENVTRPEGVSTKQAPPN